MEAQVSDRWQITIPPKVREEYRLKKKQRVKFIRIGRIYAMVPLPRDVIKALKGSVSSKKGLREIIAEERRAWRH